MFGLPVHDRLTAGRGLVWSSHGLAGSIANVRVMSESVRQTISPHSSRGNDVQLSACKIPMKLCTLLPVGGATSAKRALTS